MPYQQVYGGYSDPWIVGGDWQLNDVKHFNDVAPEETRSSFFGRVSFDLTPNAQLYVQVATIRSLVDADAVHPLLPSTQGPLIQIDNAYMPASVRTRMQTAGITNFRLGVLNRDLGALHLRTDRRTTTYTVGATGEFDILSNPWTWDMYAQKGKTVADIGMLNNISKINYNLASDAVVNPATGAIVCRITLTQPNHPCKPLNVLGYQVTTKADPGQMYVHNDALQDTEITQDVFGASITGEPFSVWAGPVSIALSAEHRKDKTVATVDAASASLDHVFGNFNPLNGETDVSEAAFETVVPITTEEFVLGKLDVNAAIRATSYSYLAM